MKTNIQLFSETLALRDLNSGNVLDIKYQLPYDIDNEWDGDWTYPDEQP